MLTSCRKRFNSFHFQQHPGVQSPFFPHLRSLLMNHQLNLLKEEFCRCWVWAQFLVVVWKLCPSSTISWKNFIFATMIFRLQAWSVNFWLISANTDIDEKCLMFAFILHTRGGCSNIFSSTAIPLLVKLFEEYSDKSSPFGELGLSTPLVLLLFQCIH